MIIRFIFVASALFLFGCAHEHDWQFTQPGVYRCMGDEAGFLCKFV
ncbi:MAG: hypothetical protein P4L87_16970 [Formivibrio sp.]|nr:hypothetical protein [Formivibrio sp.]